MPRRKRTARKSTGGPRHMPPAKVAWMDGPPTTKPAAPTTSGKMSSAPRAAKPKISKAELLAGLAGLDPQPLPLPAQIQTLVAQISLTPASK